MGGDGSQKAHLLTPNSEDTNDWSYTEQILVHERSTIGRIAIGDVDNDGVTDIFVPAYNANKILIFSFNPSTRKTR